MKRITIQVTDEMYEELKARAARRERTLARMVVYAVRVYFEKYPTA